MSGTVLRGMRGWLVAADGRWRGPAQVVALMRGRFWLARGWSAALEPDPDLPTAEVALRRAVRGLVFADAEPEVAQALLVQVLVERGTPPHAAVREAARDPSDPLELEALWLIPVATMLRDHGPHRALPVARDMLQDAVLDTMDPPRRAMHRVLGAHVAARRKSWDEAGRWLADAERLVGGDWLTMGPTGLTALAVTHERMDAAPCPEVVTWLRDALDQAQWEGLVVATDARRALSRALARRGQLAEAAHVGAGLHELAVERARWLVAVGDDAGALAALDGRADTLESAVYAACALRQSGRPDEALAVLDAVDGLEPVAATAPSRRTPLAVLLEGPRGAPPPDLDLAIAEARARTLAAVGRHGDALSSLGLALHLARGLALHGDDDGALERLETLGLQLVRR